MREREGGRRERERGSDGDHTPPGNIVANDPEPLTEPETTVRSGQESEAVEERKERPRRPAKPMARSSEYHYF